VVSDFKQTIEAVKLRNPIEDVVRERVPTLRRAGALWQACCPFHEERTPSFKVDPRRGTWRCYGACNDGGDQIKFVQRAYNIEFFEALRMLASRAGIVLPEREDRGPKVDEDPLFDVMRRAEAFYRGQLRRPAGEAALAYVRGRGLSDATIDAFGVGFAPASRSALCDAAAAVGVPVERLVELGLARLDDAGRPRDFFRGRVMFPVRDIKGRTVGFGARRLSDDDTSGPKYINTPQTPLFHKGRVIYALDMALEHIRRSGHMILVEGYTDVMAAHQAGLRTVTAVLGTATTRDHAGLVRRSGARRISLLFDGDDAGRKATLRALDGLLPLDVAIDIVRLTGVKDPCDLLVSEGRAPLEEHLAHATDWFAFLTEWVASLSGEARWKAIDQVLALLWRLPRAIVRDERAAELARAIDVPTESVREQMNALPERRRVASLDTHDASAPEHGDEEEPRRSAAPSYDSERSSFDEFEVAIPPLVEAAWRGILGAMLHAPSLAHEAPLWIERCPHGSLRRLLEAIVELDAEHPGRFTLDQVFAALADDPARDLVEPLVDAASTSDDPQAELAEHWAALERFELDQRLYEVRASAHGASELEPGDDDRDLRLLAELTAQRDQIKNQRRFAPASRSVRGHQGAQPSA